MRKAFVETLCELAERDERICLLTADLGYLALEPFRDRFPDRFLNVGVAEQNMIGVATGMAEAGLLPFAYSIAPFAALRPLEFIRNGPVLNRLPVAIVGMGMGFEYGHAGPTHYGTEDVATLRTMPGLQIVIPADSAQAAEAIRATAGRGPVYYSLGKDDRAIVPGLRGRFAPGQLQIVRQADSTIVLLVMGSVAVEACAAADILAGEHGIEVQTAVLSGFNPDPVEDAARLLESAAHVITVEAQTLSGGLAAFTAQVIASRAIACRMWPLGVRNSPDGTSGSQVDRWRKHAIDRRSIVAAVLAAARDSTSVKRGLTALEAVLR